MYSLEHKQVAEFRNHDIYLQTNVIIDWLSYNAFKQRGLASSPRALTLSVEYTYTCIILILVGNIMFDHHIALT